MSGGKRTRPIPPPSAGEAGPSVWRQGVQIETLLLVALTTFAIGVLVGRTAAIRREVAPPRAAIGSQENLPTGHPPLDSAPVSVDPQQIAAQVKEAQQKLAGIRSLQQLVQIGNRSFDDKQPIMAIAAYELALAKNPRDPDVWTDLGVMYRSVHLPEKAVDCFRRALQIDPRHPQSRLNLGIVLAFDLAEVQAAVQEWETLVGQKPPGDIASQAEQLIAELKEMASVPPTGRSEESQGPSLRLGKQGQQIMMEMSVTFTALSNAAREGSLPEAAPQVARMEALARQFAALEPIQELGPMMTQPFQRAVDQVRQAVDQKQTGALQQAVASLQERCNTCHQMMRVPTKVE